MNLFSTFRPLEDQTNYNIIVEFAKAYDKWQRTGAQEGRYGFTRQEGLCTNFRIWLEGEYPEKERYEMSNLFDDLTKTWGKLTRAWGSAYPFGGAATYAREYEQKTMHLNKQRLAWVRWAVQGFKDRSPWLKVKDAVQTAVSWGEARHEEFIEGWVETWNSKQEFHPAYNTGRSELVQFAGDYLEWVEHGAVQDKPFTRKAGVCANFERWLKLHHPNAEFDAYRVIRRTWGGRMFPFGGQARYRFDARWSIPHLNRARMRWLRWAAGGAK